MGYVRTVVELDAWAETLPWDCLVNADSRCTSETHDHEPMVGEPCAVPDCRAPLRAGETCYYVVQLPRHPVTHREQAVCWRHVRPGRGPIVPNPRVPGPGVTSVSSGCGLQACGHPGCVGHCQRP